MRSSFTIRSFYQPQEVAAVYKTLIENIYGVEAALKKKLPVINTSYFQEAVAVSREEKPVGILCLFYNPQLHYNSAAVLQVGGFECMDDENIAAALFTEAESRAVQHDLPFIIGPINGSTWDDYRLMNEEDPEIFFTENQNPAYYNRLFITAGFRPVCHYTSHISHQFIFDTPELSVLQNNIAAEGISIRPMRLQYFKEEIIKIYELCMAAFQHNFLYTPISEAEFLGRYLPLQKIIDPAFALVAEDAGGRTLAFYLCLPDLYQQAEKRVIIKTIAKDPDCYIKGLMAVMGAQIYKQAYLQGYKAIIHAFMHQSNRSNDLSRHFGGTVYRNYTLYGKSINQTA